MPELLNYEEKERGITSGLKTDKSKESLFQILGSGKIENSEQFIKLLEEKLKEKYLYDSFVFFSKHSVLSGFFYKVIEKSIHLGLNLDEKVEDIDVIIRDFINIEDFIDKDNHIKERLLYFVNHPNLSKEFVISLGNLYQNSQNFIQELPKLIDCFYEYEKEFPYIRGGSGDLC